MCGLLDRLRGTRSDWKIVEIPRFLRAYTSHLPTPPTPCYWPVRSQTFPADTGGPKMSITGELERTLPSFNSVLERELATKLVCCFGPVVSAPAPVIRHSSSAQTSRLSLGLDAPCRLF
ncbi:hypothetical protein PAAG_12501 [Paracoccidioides lutzii Pb01]|uniref:Uncharacterized protein n=1 Tax=Paracoccidioides lutzii (strain ATCC MYA-826 / Pb01) TaxID=502779 RepID=A0A0A2UZ36_PARBA|nr:hypothetical protein PAAG_12501 [Paracoccidioides lutzii Pb01]KGQ00836.1 hypothetical protein PAAG_12501 [Paracoccidioides lutzii Pb01]